MLIDEAGVLYNTIHEKVKMVKNEKAVSCKSIVGFQYCH